MLAWKIAPALAAGNTVVLKPAEFTPLTALAFAEICQEMAYPRASSISSPATEQPGEALVLHPNVNKIAFTGSTEVGRAIRGATAASHKRLFARTRRQISFHRFRRRRPGQRRGRSGRCHLAQSRPSLLRRIPASDAGKHCGSPAWKKSAIA